MKLFIKIYLKLINNFWRIVLLKFIKISIYYLFETFQNTNFVYLAENEAFWISLCISCIALSIPLIIYTYKQITANYDEAVKLNDQIHTNDTLTLQEVRSIVDVKSDVELDIVLESLLFLCLVSLMGVSTIVLGLSIEHSQLLRSIKFKRGLEGIETVLL